MNVADSERMLSLLHAENYILTPVAEDADLILLNTCHIREKARHKVLSRLGVLQSLKNSNPELQIAVTGCVAQADGKRLLELAPQIDVLLGPGKIDELPALLFESRSLNKPQMAIGFDRHSDETPNVAEEVVNIPSVTGKREVTRFVNIIQGCNNFCTFCVVPFTRGRELSRTSDDIMREVRYMVTEGAREITLLGQNVNSYGLDLLGVDEVPVDGGPFAELLSKVASVEGLDRIRFTTSNPHDFTPSLAELFRLQPKLGKHLHLPVQAGNDRTLERMKRKVTVAEYLERVRWIREAVPDIALSTDLIVGFPGETDEEFEDTLRLVEQIQYSFIYAFKYSSRRGTAAARFPDQISELVMEARLAKLNQLQDGITTKLNAAEIGHIREVLFIYESRKQPGLFIGRTPQFRTVRVQSKKNIVGHTLKV
ncbi:MAG: tRNA (N6-isopentenyl adenosine(37)-C2)-methylthiotransferase MiaB, partial [Proteobacteria bacterium]|nr:tRNA (N6-isopentenyl adenosine(37)-C2)-methylthiotransferase MiaB [Pseudomonadota bacterium]